MHVYEKKSFSPQQENILRSIAGPSQCYDNFLTQSEFDFCRTLFDSPIDWPEHGKVSKYWGFDWNSGHGPVLLWLKEKLSTVLPNWTLDFLALQEAINPWRIHADIRWYQDKIPHKVILIPLDVEPVSGAVDPDQWPDTYSITFNQYNFLSRATGGTATTGNDQSNWKRPFDNPSTERLESGYHISPEQHKKFFNHMDYRELEGLTLDKMHLWTPRSMFMWDNTALHCADNFLENNIKTKRSLMVFTLYDGI